MQQLVSIHVIKSQLKLQQTEKSITFNTYYFILPDNNEFTLIKETAFTSFIEIIADVLFKGSRKLELVELLRASFKSLFLSDGIE